MWVGKDLLRSSSLLPQLKRYQLQHLFQEHGCCIFPQKSLWPHWTACLTAVKLCFLVLIWNFLFFSLLPLAQSQGSTQISLFPSYSFFSFRCLYSLVKSNLSIFFSKLNTSSFLIFFLVGKMLQSLHHLGHLLNCLQYVHVSLGSPELDPGVQVWSLQCSVARKDHLLQCYWQHNDIAVTGMWYQRVLPFLFQGHFKYYPAGNVCPQMSPCFQSQEKSIVSNLNSLNQLNVSCCGVHNSVNMF